MYLFNVVPVHNNVRIHKLDTVVHIRLDNKLTVGLEIVSMVILDTGCVLLLVMSTTVSSSSSMIVTSSISSGASLVILKIQQMVIILFLTSRVENRSNFKFISLIYIIDGKAFIRFIIVIILISPRRWFLVWSCLGPGARFVRIATGQRALGWFPASGSSVEGS